MTRSEYIAEVNFRADELPGYDVVMQTIHHSENMMGEIMIAALKGIGKDKKEDKADDRP